MIKAISQWFRATLYYASMVFVVTVLVWVPFQSMMGQLGARIEMRLIEPLVNLRFLEFYCVDEEDNLAYGIFEKTAYPFGLQAEFLSMTLRDTSPLSRELPWRRLTPLDPNIPENLNPDYNMGILISGGCDTPFTVRTVHRSPLTDNELPMVWGPFNL